MSTAQEVVDAPSVDGRTFPTKGHWLLARGYLAALAGSGVALLTSWQIGHTSAAFVTSLILGVLLGNSGRLSAAGSIALGVVGRVLLRAGVVLLGFSLTVHEALELGGRGALVVLAVVAITFVGTQLLARAFRVPSNLALLISSGFSICGASAVAATGAAIEADEDEITYAIALVTLCGTLAIFTLPLLKSPLGLDNRAFGVWTGASVHDVAQVVATASTAGSIALAAAVVVKLARVLLLGPIVALIGLSRTRASGRIVAIPFFVLAFCAVVALSSAGVIPHEAQHILSGTRTLIFGAALFATGAGVRARQLRSIGPRPLLLGLSSWALIAVLAYAGVQLFPPR